MPQDNSVVRFSGGVNNKFDNDVLASLKCNDRTIYHEYMNDFDLYTAAQWLVGGAGTPVAPALTSGDGGIISLTTTAAQNDSNYISAAAPSVILAAGKRTFFKARAQVDSALNAAIALGLQMTVGSNNFLTPADGLYLRKPAADLNFYLVSRVGGVETLSAALGPIADATYFEVAFAYDGQGNVVGGIGGAAKASITSTLTTATLKPVAGVLAGTAVLRTMLLDYLYVADER